MNLIIGLALWVVASVAALVSLCLGLLYLLFSPRRFWRVMLAHDQAANAAFGGSEDETISSRAGRAARRGDRWGCVLCKLLDRVDPGHCEKSIGE
jgi:hypothetical protein